MKKSIKNLFILAVGLLLAILLLPLFCVKVKGADASNFKGEYISICYSTTDKGEIKWKLNLGLNTENRGLADDLEKQNYRHKISVMMQNLFDAQKAEYIKIYNQNPVEEFRPDLVIKYSLPLNDVQNDFVGYTFQFASASAYNFYHNQGQSYVKIYDNLFINKQVKEEIFPFAKLIKTQSGDVMLANYLKDKVISACQELSIKTQILEYNPQFIYDFEISTNRIKSNANLTYADKVGKYHYAWGGRLNEINADLVMKISLTNAHRGWWYVFGGGIPLVVMAVAISIVVAKNKFNQKNNQKIAQMILNEDGDKEVDKQNLTEHDVQLLKECLLDENNSDSQNNENDENTAQ